MQDPFGNPFQPPSYDPFQRQYGSMPGQPLVSPGLPASQQPTDPRYAPPESARIPVGVDDNRPEPFPIFAGENDCMRAFRQLYESTIVTSKSAVHEVAPWNSRYFYEAFRAVVNVPAAFDIEANIGGVSLFEANSLYAPVDVIVEPAAGLPVTDAVEVYRFTTSPGHATFIKSWGVTVESSRPENVEIQVEIVGGPSTGIQPPNPLISGVRADEHVPTNLVLTDNKVLIVKVRNLDPCSAALVAFGFTGWIVWSGEFDDTLESLQFPQKGYRVPCNR